MSERRSKLQKRILAETARAHVDRPERARHSVGGAMTELSVRARQDAQRILDAAARRLLAAQLDGDALAATAGSDARLVDNSTDESALLVEGQQVPVARGHGDGRRRRRL